MPIDWSVIFSAILVFIGGIVGYYINHALTKIRDIQSQNNQAKRENYKKFVSLLIDIFAGNKINNEKEEARTKNNVKRMYEFYKDYVLYASPSVIRAFANLMQYLYQNADKSMDSRVTLKLMSNVFLCMRKELGLDNRDLGDDGEVLFRAIINDYDSVMN